MTHRFVLDLGYGNLEQGLPKVTAQLWDAGNPHPMQFTGSLPPAPELQTLYQRWQQLYHGLYSHLRWRTPVNSASAFEIDETDLTHISQAEFDTLCRSIKTQLNQWLDATSFRAIDQQLRTRLNPADDLAIILVTEDPVLTKLPWFLWRFLDDYPQSEIALGFPDYVRSPKTLGSPAQEIKILAILGNGQGIDVNADRQLLQQLPHTAVTFLVEPSVTTLQQQLWEPGWEILFFAGHGSSQTQGCIELNSQDSLTIEQLKYGLQTAIRQGLKLAIFNSCDGLGLAKDLADLHIPQVIVMREPVADQVAQAFLKSLLHALAQGQSLYKAVREAREKLQALETDCPCATWLPVICQNPAEDSPVWPSWAAQPLAPGPFPPRQTWQRLLLKSLLMIGLIAGVRWFGGLQALELWAYDRGMQMKPPERFDSRIVVVTVTEQDIQTQGSASRQGSLSDATLNQLLTKLEQAQPSVIGLDIYRDFPALDAQLAQRLRRLDRLIGTCKRPDAADQTGVLPPPEIPQARLGFSDFVQDADGVVRRQLLTMSPNSTSACTASYGLGTQLALYYLQLQGITPTFTSDRQLQLGPLVFQQLQEKSGGYQVFDPGGAQILLNYRSAQNLPVITPYVTLTDILTGNANPNLFTNKIVLIGVTARSWSNDYWATPYGLSDQQKMPGVWVQAQMTSQMLSAVLDRRPLLQVWPLSIELLWIGGWTITGGVITLVCRRSSAIGVGFSIAIGLLGLSAYLWFLQAVWVPLIPAGLALTLGSGIGLWERVQGGQTWKSN
jgi:CHASE2 domain-containing sensor protein